MIVVDDLRDIAEELIKKLGEVCVKSYMCHETAGQLKDHVEKLLPIIEEIQYSGVELPPHRQCQINNIRETLRRGKEIADQTLNSSRWNFYRNLQRSRTMEKIEKTVSEFFQEQLLAHILADVHLMRSESRKRFDQLERRAESMKIGEGGWINDAMRRAEEIGLVEMEVEDNLGDLGVGLEVGKRKLKRMLLTGNGKVDALLITGIGGSGKTTLAKQLSRDAEVQSYFNNKILFLTVSQSPNLQELRSRIWTFVSRNEAISKQEVDSRALVVLDDVWNLRDLEQLMCRVPGCMTLAVSRSKCPTIFNAASTYEVELLRDDEAVALFCLSAFEQKSIPPGVSEKLVKQIVKECKGLPLALKVIGASLRDQSETYWEAARKRLSRGVPVNDSHEIKLLKQMQISLENLEDTMRECFLDLASFPEDKKIPLDILINMWVEIHGIDEEEAFAILVDLSNKNLLTLGKDVRSKDMYTSYYDIFVTQHDVLRDLALHLSNCGDINERKRLLMPKRDNELPRDWEKKSDRPFDAQIVSIHTGERKEMDWFRMEFPKAEVLILNFSSNKYFLPPFIGNMPNLRALILINNGTSYATLHDLSVFSGLANLRSLWLEKIYVPELSNATIPLRNLRKMSLILCKINNSFDKSVDMTQIFPCLSDLTIDHCDDVVELPSSICGMSSLSSLSITNCRNLCRLPANLGTVKCLEILRLYACPELKTLPPGICDLFHLKYLDISQCVNLTSLPQELGNLARLEKIDMRECSIWSLPNSAAELKSLRRVICDEDVSLLWKNVEKAIPSLHVQTAERCFDLDWLDE